MTYQREILKGLLKVRDITIHIRENSIDPQDRSAKGSQPNHECILTFKTQKLIPCKIFKMRKWHGKIEWACFHRQQYMCDPDDTI